jgi:hypothetical protein
VQRCGNLQYTGHHHWGARGIRVCARWAAFENLLADRANGLPVPLLTGSTMGATTRRLAPVDHPDEQASNRRTSGPSTDRLLPRASSSCGSARGPRPGAA